MNEKFKRTELLVTYDQFNASLLNRIKLKYILLASNVLKVVWV